ncbi:MAG: CPBP family intramembrane metalloprotease [Nitrososphaerota archaeon]|nr:CPBP family intramembrane metalloprotease [Nitrososphaerota archaeon]
MNEGPAEGRQVTLVVAVGVFAALLAFTVALVAFTFPAGVYAVFSGALSTAYTAATPVHPYFWIGPIPIVLESVVPAGALFAGLTVVYAAMLVYGAWQQRRPLGALSDSLKSGFGSIGTSPFIVMMVSIGFITFTATLIDNVTSASGVPIGGITGDPLEVFLGLTISPLVEEFGFRMVMIGVVALVLCLGRTWKEALGALWRPSKAMEGVAVGGGTSLIIWIATGLSSVTFGACHVVCGGSAWSIGKFPEAAFGGVVLGYVYVKYGFHVAVITHWGVDYFGSALAFFGQAVYGISWDSGTTEYFGQYLVDYDLLFLFGLACFLLVIYLGVSRMVKKDRSDPVQFIPPAGEGALER